MRSILLILLLLSLLLFTMVIGVQNNQWVDFNYLIAQSQLRLSSLMAIMILVGVLLASLAFSIVWLKLKWQIGQLKRLTKHQHSESNS